MATKPMNSYSFKYDFPIHELENDRVKLIPFVIERHAQQFFDGTVAHPELFKYMLLGPFETCQELIDEFLLARVGTEAGIALFAVYDKTKPRTASGTSDEGAFAGTIGYLNTSVPNLQTEIGFIVILPAFQHTHVTSNAVGLLLHYALDLPVAGGLGFRRVAWKANSVNEASVRAAERMGFTMEGVLRWDRVWDEGKGKVGNGRSARDDDPRRGCLGRDTAVLSSCWEEWENGGRDCVDRVMARRY